MATLYLILLEKAPLPQVKSPDPSVLFLGWVGGEGRRQKTVTTGVTAKSIYNNNNTKQQYTPD